MSSPPLQDAETNALQGFHDQVVVAKPISKFTHRITNVEEIPRIVAYAFRSANSGIKGPVLLDFPIDVLFTPPQQHRIAYGSIDVAPASPPSPDPASLDRLLAAWRGAKRPVIITGTGARGTDKVLKKFVESTNTPAFYSNKFSTPIPYDHFATCQALAKTPLPYENDGKVQMDEQLHPFHALSDVMKTIPQDSIIMIDGGEAGQWTAMTLDQGKPHVTMNATGYLGFLGNGWGYSIGAAVADPSRLVINIRGDGSAVVHIQELDTIARCQ